jgi:integrase
VALAVVAKLEATAAIAAANIAVTATQRLTWSFTVHTLRQSLATHLLEAGTDIAIVQVLLSHRRMESAAICMRGAPPFIAATERPFDRLPSNLTPSS